MVVPHAIQNNSTQLCMLDIYFYSFSHISHSASSFVIHYTAALFLFSKRLFNIKLTTKVLLFNLANRIAYKFGICFARSSSLASSFVQFD
jgi:hypothetical protein